MIKTGCLGPKGSYSELAAKKLVSESEIEFYPTFPAVVNALKDGAVDQIVLPIENTIQGGVVQNMDLLAEEEELFAVKEHKQQIDHRLAYREGGDLSKIRKVYSHPQALGQCSEFLATNLPLAQGVPTSSTAKSLEMLTSPDAACIIGAHLCEELQGFVVSEQNIANEKRNFTYFHLVKCGQVAVAENSNRVFLVAELPHVPGSLYNLLGIVNKHGLNMTKIESRPIRYSPGEYRFFIELEGEYSSEKVQTALHEMQGSCRKFKILGCYRTE